MKTIITAWLLPVAVVAAAMWLTAVIVRWRIGVERAAERAPPSAARSAGVFPGGRAEARPGAGVSVPAPAMPFVATFHNQTAVALHIFRTRPDGTTDPAVLLQPRSAYGALTQDGDRWVAKDGLGRELRRYTAASGADRLVLINDF